MKRMCWLAVCLLAVGVEAAVPELPADAKDVRIASSKDGSEQHAVFFVPGKVKADTTVKPAPLLVGLHSWSTNYRTSGGLADMIKGCRKRGWVLIAPNFRGPNNRPEACASDLAVSDVLDAVAYAKKHAHIDSKRIYVTGGSGGGHMTLMMVARAPDVWAAASAWVPITDLARWWVFCKQKKNGYADMMEAVCGGPPGQAKANKVYYERSPIFHMAKVKGVPVDLNAGIRDGHGGNAVPVDHTLRMFNVLARINGRADRCISEHMIARIRREAAVPKTLKSDSIDEPARKHDVLFHRKAGPVRVTLFDGGHKGDFAAAMAWLASHVKK